MPQHNLKYTPSYVLKELEGMLRIAQEDNEMIYLGSLFKDKEYSMDTIRTVINRFKDKIRNKKITIKDSDYIKIKQLVSLKKKIKEVLLAKIVEHAQNNRINPVYAMFLLKVLGKWIEAQHTLKVDHTGKVQVLMDTPKKSKGNE